MNWEDLTAKDFPRAVKQSAGVCVLPLGVMEKHGDHLPVGTDLLAVRAVCERAAKLEPAVVFPHYYFTQIAEAKHAHGTVALPPWLIWELLEATCDEIHRNGFTKILLVNGHGGNNAFLPHFAIAALDRARDYTLYMAPHLKTRARLIREIFGTPLDGHAGKAETSEILAARPASVRMRNFKKPPAKLNRLAHLGEIHTGMFWYADFPEHFAGNPAGADEKKGRELIEKLAAALAQDIRTVKKDRTAPRLQKEYQRRVLTGPRMSRNA
ncbi:MAG: creatininase family protein [Planctomycetes bacterium]|nr:creatininase family protein [Planctomycetota bacterium]